MSLTFKLKKVFSVLFLFQTCIMAFAAVLIQKYNYINTGDLTLIYWMEADMTLRL